MPLFGFVGVEEAEGLAETAAAVRAAGGATGTAEDRAGAELVSGEGFELAAEEAAATGGLATVADAEEAELAAANDGGGGGST